MPPKDRPNHIALPVGSTTPTGNNSTNPGSPRTPPTATTNNPIGPQATSPTSRHSFLGFMRTRGRSSTLGQQPSTSANLSSPIQSQFQRAATPERAGNSRANAREQSISGRAGGGNGVATGSGVMNTGATVTRTVSTPLSGSSKSVLRLRSLLAGGPCGMTFSFLPAILDWWRVTINWMFFFCFCISTFFSWPFNRLCLLFLSETLTMPIAIPPAPTTSALAPDASLNAAPTPPGNPSNRLKTYRIRLVPHLESNRSLPFEPVIREMAPISVTPFPGTTPSDSAMQIADSGTLSSAGGGRTTVGGKPVALVLKIGRFTDKSDRLPVPTNSAPLGTGGGGSGHVNGDGTLGPDGPRTGSATLSVAGGGGEVTSGKAAFRSKVVSRSHAEIWCEEGGKVRLLMKDAAGLNIDAE